MSCVFFYLNILTNLIINKYFENRCVLFVSTQNEIRVNGVFPMVNVKVDGSFVDKLGKNLHFGCKNIVVESQDVENVVRTIEKQIGLNAQRYNKRKYLLLTGEALEDEKQKSLFQFLHFVPDILLVIPENTSETSIWDCTINFSLKTHRYIGVENHDDIIELNTWYSENQSFALNTNLFPDKITNTQGRALKMATFNYKPYAVIGKTDEQSDGTEMRIAFEYAKRHNSTIKLVVDNVYEWGEIYDNRTGNGILGNVVMDNADIGFGALYTWYHEYAFLDLSLPVVRTGITCLAPAPRLLSGWFVPLFPFNFTLWTAVVASFIISVTAYLIVSYFNSRNTNSPDIDRILKAILIIRIFLLQSWPIERATKLSNPPIRFLLASVLILSLLIATCYSSGLASNMTVPRYEKSISTVEDLSETNMDWGATHEAWVFSIKSATQPMIVNVLHNFKTQTEPQLKSRTKTRNYAFSIERLPAGHFAIGSYITKDVVPNLLLMTEDIYWEQCVIMTRKSSPYIPSLNRLILRIHETGLPQAWETQVALNHLDYQVQLGVRLMAQKKHSDEGPLKLQISHVQGIFVMWLLGLVIAVNCFIIEIIVFKLRNKDRMSNINTVNHKF